MRKVKFTQDTFDEKLGAILNEFPMLDVCLLIFSRRFGMLITLADIRISTPSFPLL